MCAAGPPKATHLRSCHQFEPTTAATEVNAAQAYYDRSKHQADLISGLPQPHEVLEDIFVAYDWSLGLPAQLRR